jgi:hypothetical protein
VAAARLTPWFLQLPTYVENLDDLSAAIATIGIGW